MNGQPPYWYDPQNPPTYPPQGPSGHSWPQQSWPQQPAFPPSFAPPSQPVQPSPQPPTYPGPYGQATPPSVPLSTQYPGGLPPGNTIPPAGYPPIGYPQMPPPRRRLKKWHWGLIGCSGLLVLCCLVSVVAAALNPSSAPAQQSSQSAQAAVTNTPVSTTTPAPTKTPMPTATPVPPGTGNHMALGHNYAQNSNGFYIVGPANKFAASDQFAYVVNLDQSIGTTQAKIVLVKEDTGGAESAVLTVPVTISNPNFASFANKFPMSDLMYGDPPGKYKLEMETDTQVVADATFTYTG